MDKETELIQEIKNISSEELRDIIYNDNILEELTEIIQFLRKKRK